VLQEDLEHQWCHILQFCAEVRPEEAELVMLERIDIFRFALAAFVNIHKDSIFASVLEFVGHNFFFRLLLFLLLGIFLFLLCVSQYIDF
jgi:hypothetical protein